MKKVATTITYSDEWTSLASLLQGDADTKDFEAVSTILFVQRGASCFIKQTTGVTPTNDGGIYLTAGESVKLSCDTRKTFIKAAVADGSGDIDVITDADEASVAKNAEVAAITALQARVQSKRLTEDVVYNDEDTLADITEFTAELQDNGVYRVELVLHVTSVAKRPQFAFVGVDATVIGQWSAIKTDLTETTIIGARTTNEATAFSGDAGLDTVDSIWKFEGTIVMNEDADLVLQGAQETADASDTTLLANSLMIVTKLN